MDVSRGRGQARALLPGHPNKAAAFPPPRGGTRVWTPSCMEDPEEGAGQGLPPTVSLPQAPTSSPGAPRLAATRVL